MANATKPTKLEAIPVKTLIIDDSRKVEIPGLGRGYDSSNVVEAGDRVKIEYRPWMRHHVITTKDATAMVHETWCTWVEG